MLHAERIFNFCDEKSQIMSPRFLWSELTKSTNGIIFERGEKNARDPLAVRKNNISHLKEAKKWIAVAECIPKEP